MADFLLPALAAISYIIGAAIQDGYIKLDRPVSTPRYIVKTEFVYTTLPAPPALTTTQLVTIPPYTTTERKTITKTPREIFVPTTTWQTLTETITKKETVTEEKTFTETVETPTTTTETYVHTTITSISLRTVTDTATKTVTEIATPTLSKVSTEAPALEKVSAEYLA